MAYSTGDYEEPDYKAGVAWSDTLLPANGGSYKRVFKLDTAGVWRQPNHEEILYLLQSEKSAWPNYVYSQVFAPGVPSITQDDGRWYLYFAGLLPSDAPIQPGTQLFEPSHRRPFFVKLNVNIPASATVEATLTRTSQAGLRQSINRK